jgi:tetratricopeptide (TPR) repeat protein
MNGMFIKSIVLVAAMISGNLKAQSVSIRSVDASGSEVSTSFGLVVGKSKIVACWPVLLGSHSVTVQEGNQAYSVSSIALSDDSPLAILTIGPPMNEVGKAEAKMAADSPLLGTTVFPLGDDLTGAGRQGVKTYRVVAHLIYRHLEGILVMPPLSTILPGQCFVDANGSVSGIVVDSSIVSRQGSSETERAMLLLPGRHIIDLLQSPPRDTPIQEWSRDYGSTENAEVVRLLMSAKSNADLRVRLSHLKQQGPEWGRLVHPDLVLQLMPKLIAEQAWDLVDDFCKYTENVHRPDSLGLRLAVARAYAAAVRTPAGVMKLKEIAEGRHGFHSSIAESVEGTAQILLAEILSSQGKWDEADVHTDVVARTMRSDIRVVKMLLRQAVELKDQRRIAGVTDRLLSLDWRLDASLDTVKVMMQLGNLQEARKYLEISQQRWPDEPEVRYYSAYFKVQDNKSQDALNDLVALLPTRCGEDAANFAWAAIVYKRADKDDVIKFATAWQTERPTLNAFLFPGLWLAQHDFKNEAVAMLRRGSDRFGREATFAQVFGGTLDELGRREEAWLVFRDSVGANPENKDLLLSFGYVSVGIKKWKDGLDAYERALNVDPDDRRALAMKADALWRSGDKIAARKALTRLRAISEKSANEIQAIWESDEQK